MIEEPRLMPHLHIPLQSGSDRVLKLMNRPLSRAQLMESMEAFLEEVPRMMLSTDIIVGFPGETEEDFQETLSFVDKISFGKVHYFPYSPRPGTAAAKRVKDFVPDGVKKEREERLRKAAEEAARICRAPFQGQTFKVLTENRTKDGILGFTENYLRVCTRKELTENEIYELTIDGTETKFIAQ
jgi:threonylcarbamoyladenosine tRNA methylthiotransferase MtaB